MYPYNFLDVSEEDYSYQETYSNQEDVSPSQKIPPQSSQDKKIIKMLEDSMNHELEDADYYRRLIDLATDRNDKEVLKSISQQELKHFSILEEIYNHLTGKNFKAIFEPTKISNNILNEYSKSIYGELKGFEMYRKLYYSFLNVQIRDMIYEIMSDEQNHSIKISHLYSTKK